MIKAAISPNHFSYSTHLGNRYLLSVAYLYSPFSPSTTMWTEHDSFTYLRFTSTYPLGSCNSFSFTCLSHLSFYTLLSSTSAHFRLVAYAIHCLDRLNECPKTPKSVWIEEEIELHRMKAKRTVYMCKTSTQWEMRCITSCDMDQSRRPSLAAPKSERDQRRDRRTAYWPFSSRC